MREMYHILRRAATILLPLVICLGGIEGQTPPEGKVLYEPGFRFTDGIYLDFDAVRDNDPVPKARILTSAPYNSRDFFNTVLAGDHIFFYDEMGVRQEVRKSEIWGFASNGFLYIRVEEEFNRVTFIGNICHFVADITAFDPRYAGTHPSHIYPTHGYGVSPIWGRSYHYSPYGVMMPVQPPRKELRQFLIDFESGNVLEYEPKNVEILLRSDPELHEEYVNLRRRRQRQLMFVYVRRFNERNPLFIPGGKQRDH